MAVSAARSAAFDILLRVEGGAYAAELLHTDRISRLQSSDRGLATTLVMGVLRWQSRLDAALSPFLGSEARFRRLDTEVLLALRLAVFQLHFLDRVPERAAVNESVELVKRAGKASAAPLVNAVLRKVSGASEPEGFAGLAEEFAHPAWLVESWRKQFGDARTRVICQYNQQAPAHHIRFHRKTDVAQAIEQLRAEDVLLAPGSLLSSAWKVARGDISKTELYQRGEVAIQDEASQLVARLMGSGNTGPMLDCCAAPGGKTEVIAQRNPEADVVAVELHDHRARALARRLSGYRVKVVTGDAASLPLEQAFSRVLADVPCSGTGTLARNPEIKWRIQPQDISQLAEKQLSILLAGLDRLSAGGELVYSTCSLQREENEEVVAAAMRQRSGISLVPAAERLAALQAAGELTAAPSALLAGEYLRTIPGENDCDGFFAAIFRRR